MSKGLGKLQVAIMKNIVEYQRTHTYGLFVTRLAWLVAKQYGNGSIVIGPGKGYNNFVGREKGSVLSNSFSAKFSRALHQLKDRGLISFEMDKSGKRIGAIYLVDGQRDNS